MCDLRFQFPPYQLVAPVFFFKTASRCNSASASASVKTAGFPDAIALTAGKIEAKVTGTIDNSTVTPLAPTKAFYAKSVQQSRGPVTPPQAPSTPAESPAKFTKTPSGNFVVLGRPFPSHKKISGMFALPNVVEFLKKTNPIL